MYSEPPPEIELIVYSALFALTALRGLFEWWLS